MRDEVRPIWKSRELHEPEPWQPKGPLVEVPCNLCGRDDPAFLRVENNLRIVECRNCGLAYVNPAPTEEQLRDFYDDYYETTTEQDFVSLLDATHRRGEREICKRYPQGGRLLDVGAGFGSFLRRMKQQGWEVAGVEPNPEAARRAEETCGAQILVSTLEQADLEPALFDVLTMWYVLEHIPDPTRALKAVFDFIKPGGLLVLSIPNFEFGRIFVRLPWAGQILKPPEHLHSFTPETIDRILQKIGFGPVVTIGCDAPYRCMGLKRLAGYLYSALSWTSSRIGLRRLVPPMALTVIARKP